jgi:hypothetical protein
MDPQLLNRLLRTFVLLGMVLPIAPYLLGFPQDGSCFDIRVGQSECTLVGFVLMVLALAIQCVRFRQMTLMQRRLFLPKALGLGFIWVMLPMLPYPYWHWSLLALR